MNPKQKEIDNTKTPVQQPPQEKNDFPVGFEEQTDSSFIKFENFGDFVLGKLMAKSKSKRFSFMNYSVMLNSGDMARFHGSQQLDQLLLKAEEGDNIYVEYIDDVPSDTGKNPMKVFRVGIQKKKN